MKHFMRKHATLLLAFLMPILLIIFVVLSIYIPSLFTATQYNFVYVACTESTHYSCIEYLKNRYAVVDGQLVLLAIPPEQDTDKDGVPDIQENYTTRVFLHDTAKNESTELPLEDATALRLSALLTSPDGITISSSYERDGSFYISMGGHYASSNYYLTKGNSRSKLKLINHGDRYYDIDSIRFLGWVVSERE